MERLLAAETPVTEKLHVLALDAMVAGRYREATVIYETILLHDHRDLLALRCCFDLYLILGYARCSYLRHPVPSSSSMVLTDSTTYSSR